MAKHKQQPSRRTVFSCRAPSAQAVFLAGTFNTWSCDATPMVKDNGGTWSVALDLPRGRYEYKFIADGAWCCEPGCDDWAFQGADCVPNKFGTRNRVIEVA
jgi:1,4-alpha-glucan branching enzyme